MAVVPFPLLYLHTIILWYYLTQTDIVLRLQYSVHTTRTLAAKTTHTTCNPAAARHVIYYGLPGNPRVLYTVLFLREYPTNQPTCNQEGPVVVVSETTHTHTHTH